MKLISRGALQKWNDQLIMSYCPADGRVLGNGIKPATVEDVDEAVRAAKAAQREWASTTFVERRKVLRTMLKYVAPGGPSRAYEACPDRSMFCRATQCDS